jgi:hypothetical protein
VPDNPFRGPRMLVGPVRGSRPPRPEAVPAVPVDVRVAALVLGSTALAAFACLLLMFAGVEPLGTVNDYLNGAIGWLALALAVLVRRRHRGGPLGDAAVLAAAAGAVGMSWGSWLVITGTTGYYLAGLVSTVGIAAIGLWLLLAGAASGRAGAAGAGPVRLVTLGRPGRVTGWLMLAGILALPGVLSGVVDLGAAPWHSVVAEACAWIGLYVLLPMWCAGLRRRRAA